MEHESHHRERRLPARVAAALLSFLLVGFPASGQNLDNKQKDKEDHQKTESPIKHVRLDRLGLRPRTSFRIRDASFQNEHRRAPLTFECCCKGSR